MPALTGLPLNGGGSTGEALEGGALGLPSTEQTVFESMRDSFPGSVLDSKWLTYKPAALASAVVSGGRVRLTATQGGAGPTGSLWYSLDNATQFDGFTLYQTVGPSVGTSVSFDARIRVAVFAGDGTSQPPPTLGEWCFGGLAVHDPTRTSYYRYLHATLGTEGDVPLAGLEVKVTRVSVLGGGSVFPVAALAGDLRRDLRIVRRSTNHQVFDVYDSAVSGALSRSTGWTPRYTIVWTDGADPADDFPVCPVEVDPGLADDVQVSLINYYSNATAIVTDVEEFWIGETED